MGLFDKKYCDVCGEKIGLLGNRKLEDGNLCKDCARKLSPFFSDRRNSTVAEIKDQLAYREQNKQELSSFTPAKVFGINTKIYVDTANSRFIVSGSSDWRRENPDIISFSQVIACSTDIVENKEEIFREDKDGNSVSYNPPRYEVDYEFNMTIQVNSPWFSEIEFELSNGERPDSRFTDAYREFEKQLYELEALLTNKAPSNANATMWATNSPSAPVSPVAPVVVDTVVQPTTQPWVCEYCATQNNSKFCQSCGTPKPQQSASFRCTNCGYTQPGNATPAFCPHCGTRTGV